MDTVPFLKESIPRVRRAQKNGVVATFFFFNVTKLNRLEISLNRRSQVGASGHECRMVFQ